MDINDIEVGALYCVTDRILTESSYEWGGRKHTGGECYRRPVKALDVRDGSVLVEAAEAFLGAPPFRPTWEGSFPIPHDMALSRPEAVHRHLNVGDIVWMSAFFIDCPWDDVAEVEEPRRTRAQRREEAIAYLRECGLDRRSESDLGCIDVDVALLVEQQEELDAFRALARAEQVAS